MTTKIHATPADRQAIVDFLMTQPVDEWTTQREITAWTGIDGVTTRQVCQLYPSTFVGSTQGYKLAAYATRTEIQHAVSTLISRSEKMLARAAALSARLAA